MKKLFLIMFLPLMLAVAAARENPIDTAMKVFEEAYPTESLEINYYPTLPGDVIGMARQIDSTHYEILLNKEYFSRMAPTCLAPTVIHELAHVFLFHDTADHGHDRLFIMMAVRLSGKFTLNKYEAHILNEDLSKYY